MGKFGNGKAPHPEKVKISGKNFREQLCPPFLKKHPPSPYLRDNTPIPPSLYPHSIPTNAPNNRNAVPYHFVPAFAYGLVNALYGQMQKT